MSAVVYCVAYARSRWQRLSEIHGSNERFRQVECRVAIFRSLFINNVFLINLNTVNSMPSVMSWVLLTVEHSLTKISNRQTNLRYAMCVH